MTRTAALTVEGTTSTRGAADVEIVIPVHNEESGLEASVERLLGYLSERFPLSAAVTIVDNASTDQTWGIACRVANQHGGVRAIHLDAKGRGRALRAAWSASTAPVVAYMDVDLSTHLDALLPLVAPLLSGHSDVAIGSRLAPGARVVRGTKREFISRAYNLLLKATLRNGFTDAQCGFKALRSDVARVLLPLVEDDGWFFDTELLVLAEHNGLRIDEVPVDWVDDPDSRVNIGLTACEDVRGIWRMARRFASGEGTVPVGSFPDAGIESGLATQMVRFGGIGVMTTILFAAMFVGLAASAGPIAADIIALAVCAAVNLAANRRMTFARHGRSGRGRQYVTGGIVVGAQLAATLAVIAGLRAVGTTSVVTDLVAVTGVNALATVGRFLLLRRWVFA